MYLKCHNKLEVKLMPDNSRENLLYKLMHASDGLQSFQINKFNHTRSDTLVIIYLVSSHARLL